jgi:hypothetical protein
MSVLEEGVPCALGPEVEVGPWTRSRVFTKPTRFIFHDEPFRSSAALFNPQKPPKLIGSTEAPGSAV